MEKQAKRLTVFTPTYNRDYILPTLYDALASQTNKNFIWLIVDDGSKDKTEELVKQWAEEGKVEIKYVKQPNGGKHTAIETSNKVCETEYIVCVDSDDTVTADAVEKIYQSLKAADDRADCCGVVTRRGKFSGEPMAEGWVDKEQYVYFNDLYTKYGYSSETCLVFKTDIIKNYHFPVFEDERFVTESVYYNQFMYDYVMYASNEVFNLCEYLPDGYSVQGIKLFLKNPKGYAYALKQNAYLRCKQKESFRNKVLGYAVYYAWLKFKNLKSFKVKKYGHWFYSFAGKIGSIVFYKTLVRNFNS